MLYVQMLDLNRAKETSSKLWDITRPPSVSGSDITNYYCSWVIHPTTGAVALAWPEGDEPIHPEADPTVLRSLLQLFVDAGVISASDRDAVEIAISSNKGKRENFYNYLPTYWKSTAKTREQLEGEGWFSEPQA